MDILRTYSMEDLIEHKDLLVPILKKLDGYSHFTITESPNPWGWSPLAELKIFAKGGPFGVHILYCGSASCFDTELRQLVQGWLEKIQSSKDRIQERTDLIFGELIAATTERELRHCLIEPLCSN